MYELVQVTDRDYYIESPAKIGVVRTDTDEVCLIDAGNDQSAGKKVRRILDEHGWRLRAIYNTHSHADHIGGNRHLENCYGCSIYAPGIECAATLHPVLEPTLLFGGFAPKELRHKFLISKGQNQHSHAHASSSHVSNPIRPCDRLSGSHDLARPPRTPGCTGRPGNVSR